MINSLFSRTNIFVLVFAVSFSTASAQTGVSINATGTAPNANAILDVSSTTKGALLPRMTTAQRTTFVPTGLSGMTVYDTTTQTYWYWDGTANVWREIPNTSSIVHHTLDGAYDQGGAGAGRTITADAGSVAINVGGATTIGLTTTGNIQVSSDDAWIGAGSTIERIIFDQSLDRINLEAADVTLTDGRWIGIDASNPRIQFQGGTTDRLNIDDADVTIDNGKWFGLGSTIERIEFDGTNDEINILGAKVGVGTTAPDAQSLADFRSTTQGVLFPRLTTAERGSIGQGTNTDYGLWIYNTTTGRYNYWDGTAWQDVATINGIATSFIQNQYTSAQTVGQYWVSGNGRMDGGLTVGAGATLDNNNTNVGTVASGALAFGNASGEGIGSKRSAGGNQFGLDFYTNSVNRMAITSAGNVGIATTVADQKLQVNGVIRSKGSYMIDVDAANGAGPRIAWGSTTDVYAFMNMGSYGGLNQIETTTRDFRIGSNAAFNAFYLQNSTGNVGIGTNTPYAKLNVGDANGPSIYLTREDVVTTSGEVLGSLLFDSTDDTSPSNSDASVVIRATASQDHGNSNKGGYLTFLTKDNWGNGTAALERMRIQANGNVGIGSTAPAFKLHLGVGSGDGLMIGNHNDQLGWNGAGIGPDLSIRFAGYRDVVNNFTGAKIAGIRTNVCCSGLSQGMELAFYTQEGTATVAGDGNLTERLRIGNGGNVGIGIAVPVQKLHVVGTIRSTALAVASNRIVQANASGDLSASALDPSTIMTSTNISGTTNVIPKFTGTNSIGNSLTTDDGTSVTTSGQFDVTGGTGTVYTTAPIEVRTTSTPRVSFHWPGVVASQIGMDAGGVIRTFNNPGTGYEQFAASNITANGFFNTTTGYRISNAATAGNYLRGDGSNFVSSAIQAGDIPTGSGNYIQNQIAVDQAANSRISGSSSANVYYVNHGSGNVIEVGDDSWIADVNLGNTTGIYGQQNTNHGGIRLGSNGGAVLYSDGSDGIGLGTTAPASKLHVMGKTNIHQSGAGGGQNRFEGILAPTDANGRAQLVLSSSYSDLVIASSQANDNHGSTLTFATYNPGNAADYRKFVINQGNWGARRGFLDFGFSDAGGRTNPHSNINGTDNVLSMDGFNKRVGIGTMGPSSKLEILHNTVLDNGIYASSNIEVATNNASNPSIGFHREGYSATALYHSGYGNNSLRIRNADGLDAALLHEGNVGSYGIQNQNSFVQGANFIISGTGRADGDFRAPIFYDQNNTGFYLNPDNISILNDIRPSILYDRDNTGYYLNPNGTTRLYNMNTLAGFDGYYPANSAIRMTPNFHFNTPAGYAMIVNWDNGAVGGGTQQFRVGNGTGTDQFYVRADGGFYGRWFGDLDDGGYSLDPNSTSNSALRIRGGALHGPNPSWGAYLLVGGDGRNGYVDNGNTASVSTTNGNLHIDAASGYGTYINFYDGDVIYFGRGNNTTRATLDGNGLYLYDGWLRPHGQNGLYFQDYGGGWHMTDATWIRSYNSKNVYVNTTLRADGGLETGGGLVLLRNAQVGTMGQATACDFGLAGVDLEQGVSEGAGFHADGDQANIWSPGDGDRLLRVHDEDLMGTEAASERWYLNGSGTAFTVSDRNKKQNIVPLNNSLSKIVSLNGYNYEFKKTAEELAKGDFPKLTSGVIAQEVEILMPELVDTDEEGNKFMNYDGLTPYLIEAIKEQQTEIEELSKRSIDINDFGSAEILGPQTWVAFGSDFVSKNQAKNIPIVTATPTGSTSSLRITKTTINGFMVEVIPGQESGGSFNWMAMAKAEAVTYVKRNMAEEALKRQAIIESSRLSEIRFKEHQANSQKEAEQKNRAGIKEMELPADFDRP